MRVRKALLAALVLFFIQWLSAMGRKEFLPLRKPHVINSCLHRSFQVLPLTNISARLFTCEPGTWIVAVDEWQMAENTSLSASFATSQAIREFSGPESFRLRISGPDVQMLAPLYLGSGLYLFTEDQIGVNPGCTEPLESWFALIHLHSDYDALQELRDEWGVLHRSSFCFKSTRICSKRILPPECKRNAAPSAGRWILRNFSASDADRFLGLTIPSHENFSSRNQLLLDRAEWVPTDCRPRQIDLRSCLKGKKLLFMGDSHMRVLFSTISQHFNMSWREPVKGWEEFAWLDEGTMTSLQYLKNPWGEPHNVTRSMKLTEFDRIFFNFGNWPAAQWHWTFERYRNACAVLGQSVLLHGAHRHVWVETHPIPPRDDYILDKIV